MRPGPAVVLGQGPMVFNLHGQPAVCLAVKGAYEMLRLTFEVSTRDGWMPIAVRDVAKGKMVKGPAEVPDNAPAAFVIPTGGFWQLMVTPEAPHMEGVCTLDEEGFEAPIYEHDEPRPAAPPQE